MRVCPYCTATNGLKGSDLIKGGEKDMDDDEVFAKHIEDVHHIPVIWKGETKDQCEERFYKTHPEAKDPKTCKCPICEAERR